MIKLSIFLSLTILIGCSSIKFSSSNNIPVTFEYSNDKSSEVSIVVSKPFYMWGLVPKQQVVEVDKVFVSKGFKVVSDLSINEIENNKKALWMFFTFGMYYPQSFKLTANVN
ncbi:MAG: hypothetical protein ACJAS4_001007 [Bacteriovoracaceae bacterium]|jgi:hypothetical protein